ncbi:MAG: hypothetical protein ACTSWY_13505 [Promethearchaeota archaeon]
MQRGTGRGRGGRGLGRGGGNMPGSGPGGLCKCPNCGTTKAHQIGLPCFQETCPKCGTKMVKV